ncbi:unnamed protein product [Schistosoma margrebowiei]|uniref:Uncharacterized protein n=1 Tax=Schistosoma margrebowiei TaxID=48269 RepID=A0A183LSK9_9TREM|nr:unnamed protein product [Schistosoma margrebowiei]
MARTAFQNTKDPMESAVFYLAMHKAKMVAALFKTTGNKTLENFFRSDFTPGQPACRQAKLNAFRLLSQHKYLQAAGLFLLAGCLNDAVRVCLDTLKDLQMGILLVRLYTSSAQGIPGQQTTTSSTYHDFLREHIIKHQDPFLRSMAFWTLGDPLAALQTLLEGPGILSNSEDFIVSEKRDSLTDSIYQSPQHPQYLSGSQSVITGRDASKPSSVCPSVFKFYTYLQSHPLVLRHQRLQAPNLINSTILYRVKSLERRLYFRTAHHYFILGCPTLALEVLTKLPPLESSDSSSILGLHRMSVNESIENKSRRQSVFSSDAVVQSVNKQNNDDDIFTFMTPDVPLQKSTTEDQFTLEWSDDNDDQTDHDDTIDHVKSNTVHMNQKQQMLSPSAQQRPSLHSIGSYNIENQGVVDLMANQLKFIACLKILAEELSTLAAGAEDDGMPITNIHLRLGRWAEFFEGQFIWPAAPATSVRLSCPPWPVTTDPPNEEEVRKELQLLRRSKSPGPDDLPPALFKDGGDFLTKELTNLFTKVWELESVPTSWNESIVVPIFKKGSRRSCNNYRGISLLPIASKLLASVILRRLFKTRERLTREEQAGFRSGRGCIDHIFTLRQM